MRWSWLLACTFVAACFSEDTGPAGGSGPDDGDGDGTTSDIDVTSGVDVTSGTVPTTGVDASTGSGDTTGGEATSIADTGEPECDGDGARDEACPAEAPYCTSGTCTACPELPGGCGEIDPAMPVCDAVTGACTACTEHDECGSGACRIATGECFEDDNRLWVSANADCMAATGSEAAPFCTIDEALAAVVDQPGREPWAVLVAGAGVPYVLSDDAALFGRPLALIGPSSGATARLVGLPPAHLDVSGAGQDYYLARVSFDGNASEGTVLDCASGDLWVDDVQIEGGTDSLAIGGCEVRMRRSRISQAQQWGVVVGPQGRFTLDEGEIQSSNGGVQTEGITTLRRTLVANHYGMGGISAPAGSLSLSNCMMFSNVYSIGHIDIGSNVTASLNYVTAITEALSCTSANSTYEIRNSIVDTIECPGMVMVDQSLVAPGDEGLGADNVPFPPADYTQVFEDHPGGDLHVRMDPPPYLLGIAIPSASDPAVDFDGDARPGVGQPDYPGADAPP
jgi:hypothetical protein